jgi:hypothetical protein
MKKINSVEIVRKIRDNEYEKTKSLSGKKLLEYYRESARVSTMNLSRLMSENVDSRSIGHLC